MRRPVSSTIVSDSFLSVVVAVIEQLAAENDNVSVGVILVIGVILVLGEALSLLPPRFGQFTVLKRVSWSCRAVHRVCASRAHRGQHLRCLKCLMLMNSNTMDIAKNLLNRLTIYERLILLFSKACDISDWCLSA